VALVSSLRHLCKYTDPLLFAVKRQHLFCLGQESMVSSNQFKAHHDYLYICNSMLPVLLFDGWRNHGSSSDFVLLLMNRKS
jgi:hypothetical protein